jgi:hypothetical protein
MMAGTGTGTGSNSTAFALKSNLNESTVKLKNIIDGILDSAIKPFWHMYEDLQRQFSTPEAMRKVLGAESQLLEQLQVQPDEVLSDYDVVIYAADELISDNYQVQNIMSYLNWQLGLIPLMTQISQSTGQPVTIPDVNALGDMVWKKIGFKQPIPKVQLQIPQAVPGGPQGGPNGNKPTPSGDQSGKPLGGPNP